MKPLTSRQQEVLDFMRAFFADNDQLPTMACIAKRFGFKSANAAQFYIDVLEDRGYIERNTLGKYRFSRTKAPPAPRADTPVGMLALPVVSASALRGRQLCS